MDFLSVLPGHIHDNILIPTRDEINAMVNQTSAMIMSGIKAQTRGIRTQKNDEIHCK